MQSMIDSVVTWVQQYQLNILLSVGIVVTYYILRRIAIPKIENFIERDGLKNDVLRRATTALSLFSGTIALAIILFVWGFDFKGLLALSTGLIALTGAALFASWSILSNITAFFLLLTHQSYRKGNFIRVIDVDNYIEGYISEINLFNTKLLGEKQEVIIYPNNLLISRPTIINPEEHYTVVGKTTDFLTGR